MVVRQAKNMRLRQASTADSQWMQAALERISRRFAAWPGLPSYAAGLHVCS